MTFEDGVLIGSVKYSKGRKVEGGRFSRWVGDHLTYTVGEPCDWMTLGSLMGAQKAAYTTGNPTSKAANRKSEQGFRVHCQECGKVCTEARGGEVLTRSTVVCGKCHDEAKHGPCSSVTRHVTAVA